MSYVRWSSIRGDVKSDWYIFWHSMSGSDSNKKEEQYLAMWNCSEYSTTHEYNTPTLDYCSVKKMLETDDWSLLGYENLTQKDILIDCVKRWIINVEEDCT